MDVTTLTPEQKDLLIEDQVKSIAALSEKIAAFEATNKAQADKIAELETAEESIANLKKELEGVMIINEKLTGLVADAPAPAEAKKDPTKATLSEETFKVGEDLYEFAMAKIFHKGEVVTADEVLGSEDLAAELVKMGSGMIRKVIG